MKQGLRVIYTSDILSQKRKRSLEQHHNTNFLFIVTVPKEPIAAIVLMVSVLAMAICKCKRTIRCIRVTTVAVIDVVAAVFSAIAATAVATIVVDVIWRLKFVLKQHNFYHFSLTNEASHQ